MKSNMHETRRVATMVAIALTAVVALGMVACAPTAQSVSSTIQPGTPSPQVDASQSITMNKHARYNTECVECHEGTDQTQYTTPDPQKCLDCHGGSYEALVDQTPDATGGSTYATNPHMSHIGEADCSLCHKNHSESTLYCNECHTPEFSMVTP